jgi:hypothetical protein
MHMVMNVFTMVLPTMGERNQPHTSLVVVRWVSDIVPSP